MQRHQKEWTQITGMRKEEEVRFMILRIEKEGSLTLARGMEEENASRLKEKEIERTCEARHGKERKDMVETGIEIRTEIGTGIGTGTEIIQTETLIETGIGIETHAIEEVVILETMREGEWNVEEEAEVLLTSEGGILRTHLREGKIN